jgi:hypothetical protein
VRITSTRNILKLAWIRMVTLEMEMN